MSVCNTYDYFPKRRTMLDMVLVPPEAGGTRPFDLSSSVLDLTWQLFLDCEATSFDRRIQS